MAPICTAGPTDPSQDLLEAPPSASELRGDEAERWLRAPRVTWEMPGRGPGPTWWFHRTSMNHQRWTKKKTTKKQTEVWLNWGEST